MKAAVCYSTNVSDKRCCADATSTVEVEGPLLREIRQFGGDERMRGAAGALDVFRNALTELVRENPKRYGADDDAVSQDRVVSQLCESVSNSFLLKTVEELRRHAGYIRLGGRWVHRAVFTFAGFGFLLAGVLPFCIVSVMSTAAWGWLPGAFGLILALVLGGWILKHVKSN